MLGGFDPRLRELFIHRRRGTATVWGVLLLLLLGAVAWLAYPPEKEEVVQVQLEPEIEDFAIEEDEPEPEPEPPPPPPPDTKVEVVENPRPEPKPKPPEKKVTEAADESAVEKTVEVGAGGAGTPSSMGSDTEAEPRSNEPKPKPQPEPKPKPKPKPEAKPKKAPIDPTKPIDRPENATAPKPEADNPSPVYPKELRDKGITGQVIIKLNVYRDGTVRGAKILRKSNNAATDEEKERANKLFVSAVIKAVKAWRFEPSELNGEPITVWYTQKFPFSLTTD